MSAIKARWRNAFVIVTLICSQPLLASDREERLNAGLAALKREHYATALRSWLPLAEAGDPEAQANVGYMYEEGLGVSQQLDVAVGWYEKAAASGSMQANHNLGMIFAEGRGTPQSWVRALRYFEEAANDIPASRYMIGYTYFQGEGNVQNRPRAFREFMDAALDGYADAQYMIAFMYLDGSGIPKQPIQAYIVSPPAAIPYIFESYIALASQLSIQASGSLDDVGQEVQICVDLVPFWPLHGPLAFSSPSIT